MKTIFAYLEEELSNTNRLRSLSVLRRRMSNCVQRRRDDWIAYASEQVCRCTCRLDNMDRHTGIVSTAPDLDQQVLVAGGNEEGRRSMQDEAVMDWLRSRVETTSRIGSVCSGAFVLAASGLLADPLCSAAVDPLEISASRPAPTNRARHAQRMIVRKVAATSVLAEERSARHNASAMLARCSAPSRSQLRQSLSSQR